MPTRIFSALLLGMFFQFAAPALAADAPLPISAFVHASKFSLPRLSPDGKHLAMRYTTPIDGRDQKLLNVYETDGMKLISSIRLPVFQMPLDFNWVSNTRLIVSKGTELGYLEVPGWTGEILGTDLDGQKQEYLYGYYNYFLARRGATAQPDDGLGLVHSVPDSPNGRFYMRELKGGNNYSRTFLYDVNASNGVRKLIADLDGPSFNYLLQHDGKPRIAFGDDEENERMVFIREADRDKWQPLSKEKIGKVFMPIAFSANDQQVYVLRSEDGGPNRLVRQSLNGDDPVLIAADAVASIDNIESGLLEPFAFASELGVPKLRYIDDNTPDAQLHQALSKQFPGQFLSFTSSSADGSRLVFKVSSDREPGEFYLFDMKTKKAEFLVAAQPDLDAARMAERKPIQFKARDGLELHGYLTLPPNRGDKKLPLVLLPHGGPLDVADTWYFDADAQFLASRGYAVLQVNFRGSAGRGENFVRAGYRQWATGMQHDLIDGVKWTISQGIVDPARICSFGASFGAYAAMMTAIIEPEMFKCAVGYSGRYDLTKLMSRAKTNANVRAINFYTKALGDDPEALRRISPAFLADKIKVPVLLVHGEQDKVTTLDQAEAMRDALTKANKPVEWMLVPKEGHGFYAEKNRLAFYEKLEAFLAKHLAP